MHNLKKKILEILKNSPNVKSPEAETNLILFNVFRNRYGTLGKYADLFTEKSHLQYPLTPEIEDHALRMVEERIKGVPLQHITHNQFFYEHEYVVNSHVLIPRPETEILVDQVISHLKTHFKNLPFTFLELGLGSGVISTEILHHFINSAGISSETSPQAIAVARQNLDHILGRGKWENRFRIVEPSTSYVGFELFLEHEPVDLVVSNPPYVSVHDEIDREVLRFEPHAALFPMLGGDESQEKENPDYFYESFLYHYQKILKPDGTAFFEIPHERAKSIEHEFINAGFKTIQLIPDLTGRPRVLKAQK